MTYNTKYSILYCIKTEDLHNNELSDYVEDCTMILPSNLTVCT